MTTHKIVCVCEIHQTHAYHIVNPSPWPLSVLLITSGLGILFHFNSTTPLLLGLLTNTLTMYQWWWDIQESAFQRHYTPTVQKGLCCGVFFFFFFKSSQRSYFLPVSFELFIIQVSSSTWAGWMLTYYKHLSSQSLEVLLLNTSVLLASRVSITWAQHSLTEGNQNHILQALFITIALGIYFTHLQASEYCKISFTISDGF